jgi:hypothetical protein
MDTSKLKRFAPECRTQLMEQVGVKLDHTLTAKTPDLAAAASLIRDLEKAIEREGREAVIDRIAYTWFNRLAALRYLDARGWHPFRLRVVTPATEEDTQPELLRQVRQGIIPEELQDFVSAQRVNDLLDGKLPSPNPQAEVQRLLVIGVCQYYAFLLPSLFERLDDFSQLLLPDDLLTEHSAVNGFRTDISDDDCSEVEILGWLYQFYISEKKDAVMARKKAVPSEDIPAVTQLFTPHWIVRYLVENSLGRLWLRSRPNSRLKEHMPYYVEDPAPSAEASAKAEGQAPADSLTVATPEEIKLLDPACGSGHMLTYAFDLLVKIYEEEGHAPSEIPEKILTHNLFGLEICPRAAQLASFALVCKAREQSRRAFRGPNASGGSPQPQVMFLRDVVITPEEVKGFTDATRTQFSQDELAQIHQFREHTETFGSLIQPVLDGEKLAALKAMIGEQAPAGDLLVQNTHRKLRLVLDQAEMLSQRYQIVVANPPYLGGKQMAGGVKDFAKSNYPKSKTDYFAMFLEHGFDLVVRSGWVAMVTMESWMFLSSLKQLRSLLLERYTLLGMVHMPYLGKGGTPMGINFGTAATIWTRSHSDDFPAQFQCIRYFECDSKSVPLEFPTVNERFATASADDLKKIPEAPIAYWVTPTERAAFEAFGELGARIPVKQGLATADNDRFVRLWHEASFKKVGLGYASINETRSSTHKWFPYNKGGDFRKWYGNNECIVNWENDGRDIRSFGADSGRIRSRAQNTAFYFKASVTWTFVSSSSFGVRFGKEGSIFDVAGSSAFPEEKNIGATVAFLVSKVALRLVRALNPTLNFQVGDIASLPFTEGNITDNNRSLAQRCIGLARADWDNFETSWDFRDLPLLRSGDWEVEPAQPGGPWKGRTLAESWANYAAYCTAAIRRMQELETENNRLWIDAYGLQEELTPEVPEDEITLARADRRKDVAAFLSYAVGCMMGRYSLDQPGLILADAGDTLEQYFEKVGKSAEEVTFLPDDDGIIPITEDDWFEDDAASRVREFLKATFDPATVDENVAFIEEALGKDLRKYFTANTGGFYADHVKTYKKRPIYWMFESPKKHFRAFVYLHRYNKDTINSLLDGYVREFSHKLTGKIGDLEAISISEDASAREKTAALKALEKAKAALRDVEDYERNILLPLAQQRIELDLDDGVKANYPKFGKALAKVAGLS